MASVVHHFVNSPLTKRNSDRRGTTENGTKRMSQTYWTQSQLSILKNGELALFHKISPFHGCWLRCSLITQAREKTTTPSLCGNASHHETHFRGCRIIEPFRKFWLFLRIMSRIQFLQMLGSRGWQYAIIACKNWKITAKIILFWLLLGFFTVLAFFAVIHIGAK